MDFNNEKFISNFIENQFPRFYQEDGPDFILFVKAYYEWLETAGNVEGDGNGGPVREARELLSYRDIDGTIERFLEFFQKKYLYGIPFNIISNKRFLLKHILDVYRSKGTIQCYKLLFKLIYNEDITVYLPSTDMLKVSDGTWYQPKYLEVTENARITSYVGKIIIGTSSRTRAVVENYIQENIDKNVINLLYISNISPLDGNFVIGEKIVLEEEITDFAAIQISPTLLGSLDSISILSGGQEFNVGDILKIAHRDPITNEVSSHGSEGLLRVTEVGRALGGLNFDVVPGGFGFTSNALNFVYRNLSDSTGNGASFSLYSLSNTYNIEYNTDIIYDYSSLQIGASSYGFPGNTVANSSYAIAQNLLLYSIDLIGANPTGYDNTDIITIVNNDGGSNATVTFTTNSTGGALTFTIANTGRAFANQTSYTSQVTNSTGGTATGNNNASIFYPSFSSSNGALSFSNQNFGSIFSLTNIVTGNGYTQPANVFVRSTQLTKALTGNVSYNTDYTLYSISANNGTGYNNTDVIVFRSPISNLNITDNRTTNPAELHAVVGNTRISIVANTTGYSNTNETISITNANTYFAANDSIYYMVPAGNTAIGGLTANTYYYINYTNSSTITLKSTLTGANVDITGNVTSNGESHYIYIGKKITANTTGFSNTADVIVVANASSHFALNDRVYYRVPASNTAIAGLTGNTWYYVNFVNSTSIALANSEIQVSNDATVTMVTNTTGGNLALTITSFGNNITNASPILVFANSSSGLSNGSGANLTYSFRQGRVTGDGTSFTDIFVNNDVIFLQANSSLSNTAETEVIREVINSTSMFLFGPPTRNSTASAVHKAAPVILPSEFAYYEPYMFSADGTINGINDNITAIPSTGNNVVVSVKSIDSGIGYLDGELVKIYLYGALNTPQVIDIGSGYVNGDVIIFTGGETSATAAGYITTFSNGSVANTTLTYAGSGYKTVPTMVIRSANGIGATLSTTLIEYNTYSEISGRVTKKSLGTGEGYWTTTRGFLNSDKYIQDSYYYQDYSYEIRVGLTLNKYKDILYNTFHVAGSELFGKFNLLDYISSNLDIIYEQTSATTYIFPDDPPSLRADSTEVTVDNNIYTVDSLDPFSVFANTLGFSNTADVINIVDANSFFVVDDYVYYQVPTNNTAIASLTANSYYYITFSNSTSIALSNTVGGANINITDARTTNPSEIHSIYVIE